MTDFSFISAFSGGIMIGFATVLMFLGNGRITGISSIVGGIVKLQKDQLSWRIIFILSLMAGGAIYPLLWGREIPVHLTMSWPAYVLAGLIVGFGTRMGSGCTSGHGICGIARFSPRSIVATLVFILSAMVTQTLIRLLSA